MSGEVARIRAVALFVAVRKRDNLCVSHTPAPITCNADGMRPCCTQGLDARPPLRTPTNLFAPAFGCVLHGLPCLLDLLSGALHRLVYRFSGMFSRTIVFVAAGQRCDHDGYGERCSSALGIFRHLYLLNGVHNRYGGYRRARHHLSSTANRRPRNGTR